MIRVKTKFTERMQNFLFIDGEIFYTTANLTIWQKLKRLWSDDTREICNTSRGFTLPSHGQYIRYDGYHIICMGYEYESLHDKQTGELIENRKTSLPNVSEIRKLKKGVAVQGVAFKGDEPTHASFGWSSKTSIDIYDLKTKRVSNKLEYQDYKEWWWSHWEAEGIQWNNDGELEVGFNVKAKWWLLGFHVNYTEIV